MKILALLSALVCLSEAQLLVIPSYDLLAFEMLGIGELSFGISNIKNLVFLFTQVLSSLK